MAPRAALLLLLLAAAEAVATPSSRVVPQPVADLEANASSHLHNVRKLADVFMGFMCLPGCFSTLRAWATAMESDIVCRNEDGQEVTCTDIKIKSLQPMVGKRPSGSIQMIGTVVFAREINLQQHLLPGYRIVIETTGTDWTLDTTTDTFVEMSHNREEYAGLLVGDPVTASIGVTMRYQETVNAFTLYASPKADIDNALFFPLVVNHYMSEIELQVRPAIAFARQTGWRNLVVVNVRGDPMELDNAPHFSRMFQEAIQAGDIDGYSSKSMVWDSENQVDLGHNGGAAQLLIESNSRIVIFDAMSNHLAYFACELYRAGMTGFVFFLRAGVSLELIGGTDDRIYSTNGCTNTQIQSVGQMVMVGVPASWTATARAAVELPPESAQLDSSQQAVGIPPPPYELTCLPNTTAVEIVEKAEAHMADLMSRAVNPVNPMPYQLIDYAIYMDQVCHFALVAREMLVSPGSLTVEDLTNPAPNVLGEMVARAKAMQFLGVQGMIQFSPTGVRQFDQMMFWMRASTVPQFVAQGTQQFMGMYSPVSNSITPMQMTWYDGGVGYEGAPSDAFPVCPSAQVRVGDGCQPCSAEEVFLQVQNACVCRAGYRMIQSQGLRYGHTCEPCPAGTYSDTPGSTVCTPCFEGHYADEEASVWCRRCEYGKYQPETGKASCIDCNATFSTETLGAQGPSQCVCAENYVYVKETRDADPVCKSCADMVGLVCPGGNGPPVQMGRYATSAPDFLGALPERIVKCSTKVHCPEGLDLGSCPPHRESYGCGLCEVGFVDNHGECIKCQNQHSFLPIMLTVLAALLVSIAIYVFAVREVSVKSQTLLTVTITGSIFFNIIQVLGAFREIDIAWPEPMPTIYSVLEIFTFRVELLNPGCVFGINKPEMAYLGAIMTFPIFTCFMCFIFFIARYVPRPLGRRVSPLQAFNTIGLIMLAFYTSLAITSVLPWQCEENPDGTSSVVSRRTVLCWDTGEHISMLIMSCFAMLVYILGFFSVIIWATRQYPRMVSRQGGIDFLRGFNFLFERFKPQYFYYGTIFCLRNLTIAILPVLFTNSSSLQLLLLALTVTVTMVLQCWLRPWRVGLANLLDATSSMGLMMVLTGGILIVELDAEEAKLQVSALFIVIVSVFIAAASIIGAICAKAWLFPVKPYGIFLCHHKVGAGSLARWMKYELEAKAGCGVFLDSDNLESLDLLFGMVAFKTRNLVVICSKLILERIWCAGEIATAAQRKVNTVKVLCDDYKEPTDDFIEGLGSLWFHDEVNVITKLGVQIGDIQEAFKQFRKLSGIELNRTWPWKKQEVVCEQLLKNCYSVTSMSWKKAIERDNQQVAAQHGLTGNSASDSNERLVLVGDLKAKDPELLVTCVVLQRLLQGLLQIPVDVAGKDGGGYSAEVATATSVLPVLTKGILESPDFATAMAAAVKQPVSFVPIVADRSFAFPSPVFYEALEQGKVVQVAGLGAEELISTYKHVFGHIALEFTPHASSQIQETQVVEVAKRFRALQGSGQAVAATATSTKSPTDSPGKKRLPEQVMASQALTSATGGAQGGSNRSSTVYDVDDYQDWMKSLDASSILNSSA